MKQSILVLFLAANILIGRAEIASFSDAVVPFTLNDQGHILFHAKFNGVEGNFIFDTGAGINLVTKKFADRLKGLIAQDGIFTGFRAIGDRLDIQLFQVHDLSIGSWSIANPMLTWLDQDWGDIDGIISLKNFEKDVIVTIDYNASTLTISPKAGFAALKKSATASFPIQLDDTRGISVDMFCYVRVNNGPVLQFSMDSGSGKDVLRINQQFMSKLHIDSADSTHVRRIVQPSEFKAGNSNVMYITSIGELAVSGAASLNWKHPQAQFTDGLIYDGIMSINWMGKKITISIPDKEMAVWR
jgi:aspartyl protease